MKRSAKKKISDRAKRYRAQRNVAQPAKLCVYCGGQPAKLDVDHINGDEGDGRSDNLARACRPCNTRKGLVFSRAGIGIRTVQSNPASGARSLEDWRGAIDVLLGRARGSLLRAVSKVRATPSARRVELARESRGLAVKLRKANPGAPSYEAWYRAWSVIRGSRSTAAQKAAAKKTIDATPADLRSEYNRRIWEFRHARGEGAVPF